MKVTGVFRFVGVERRSGFKDPTKTFCIAAFAQGLDVLRVYVDDMQFSELSKLEPYSEVDVELDYNPVAERNQMRLVTIL